MGTFEDGLLRRGYLYPAATDILRLRLLMIKDSMVHARSIAGELLSS
jgi:hypothetical protein